MRAYALVTSGIPELADIIEIKGELLGINGQCLQHLPKRLFCGSLKEFSSLERFSAYYPILVLGKRGLYVAAFNSNFVCFSSSIEL